MCTVYRAAAKTLRTLEDVKNLQKICVNAGLMISEVLFLRTNTRLLRLMYHLEDHLLNSGCLRRAFTNGNETLHKHTKRLQTEGTRNWHRSRYDQGLLQQRKTQVNTICFQKLLYLHWFFGTALSHALLIRTQQGKNTQCIHMHKSSSIKTASITSIVSNPLYALRILWKKQMKLSEIVRTRGHLSKNIPKLEEKKGIEV